MKFLIDNIYENEDVYLLIGIRHENLDPSMKFAIDNICEPEDVYLVTGICYEDIDREKYLKINDVFLKAYKDIYKKTSKGNYKLVERKDIRDLKLQVKKL